MLDVPVFVGGELRGVLCHEHVGPPRDLGAHEQQIAMAVAQSLAQVLEAQARRRAEEAVRASEARFRKLVEIAPVPILVSRLTDGRILYANHGLELLLRTDREAILARSTTDFYYDPSERAELIATLRRDGFLKERELRIRRPDGTTFWGMISVHPMEFDGQQALIAGLVDLSEHKRAEEEVQRVLKALEERDALLTADLERARAFQDSMQPAPPAHPAVEIDVLFHPAEEVSGDVYDFELDGTLLRAFVADATGHGVSAALTTMFLRSEYEVASHSERAPGAVLRALNARMIRFLGRFAMRFTAACWTLDLTSGELRWATAAHPPLCVVRDGHLVELETGGSFVGLAAEAEFPERVTTLRPGDLLVAYTDGLSEALDGTGKPLGERRLYDHIAAAAREGQPVGRAALEAASAWAGRLQDDATLVVVRWRR
jgi:sigma-B regulation protein RsbU (phosphoserine phosphatase)